MGLWTAITIIAITSLICGAITGGKHNRRSKQDSEELEALRRKIDMLDNDLHDRVETLEKIVTDRKENLRREFDYLDKAS